MTRWTLAVACLILAGCTGPTAEPLPEPAPGPEERAQAALLPAGTAAVQPAVGLDGPRSAADTTRAPWWFIATEASPDGAAAGFTWTVPKGALVPHEFADDFDTLNFEAGAIVGDSAITGYMLSVYHLEGDEASLLGQWIAVPMEVMVATTPVLADRDTYEPDFDPFHLTLFAHGVEAGDRLGFVLAGFGEGPVGLAFRLLDHDPEFDEDAAANEADLLDGLRELGQGMTLRQAGTADATRFDVYLRYNFGIGVGMAAIELRTGHVEVIHALPTSALEPLPTVRDVRLSTEAPYGRGYSASTGFYLSMQGAAQYEATSSAHGESLESSGVTASVPFFAMHAFMVVGEGEGGAATSYWTRSVDSNAFHALALMDFGHSATLAELLGVPARTGSADFASLPQGQLPGQDLLRIETPLGPVQLLVR